MITQCVSTHLKYVYTKSLEQQNILLQPTPHYLLNHVSVVLPLSINAKNLEKLY